MILKTFCAAKKTINKMKRQPTEWEKISANHISGKWLIYKIYKDLIQLNRKKNSLEKWVDNWNRHFSREDIHTDVQQVHEKMPSIINHQGNANQNTMRHHLTPVRMAITKKIRRASLVAQWLRICLPMQGTRVHALVWEDSTCRGAAGPVSHNY